MISASPAWAPIDEDGPVGRRRERGERGEGGAAARSGAERGGCEGAPAGILAPAGRRAPAAAPDRGMRGF